MCSNSRLAFLSVLAVLSGLSGATLAPAASTSAPTADRIVIMISIDGLAGFYLDDPEAKMPTIRALAAEGVSARMKASNPTVTWPNHATLVTGVHPARHGVIGNNYLDRTTGKRIVLIADPQYDKDDLVRVPTIYDVAHAAGLKTAAILWPATRNAKTLDWTVPDVHDIELYQKYSTPGLLEACARAGIPAPWTRVENVEPQVTKDESTTRMFNLILREHRPQLALLHLVNVDHMQHLKGPRTPEAYAAIATIDAHVAQVWETLKRDFPDKATLVIVSDHGFSRIRHAIFPNVMLREAGLIDVKGPRVVGGDVNLVPQGGCAMLYLDDDADRAETIARIQRAFTGVKGIRKLVTTDGLGDYGLPDPKADPRGPDLLLLAEDGYFFGDTAAGQLPFAEKPERAGSHGHDASIPNLYAAFIAWGSGIRRAQLPGAIENIDVTPTLAKLLHLDMPNLDGKPVTAALEE